MAGQTHHRAYRPPRPRSAVPPPPRPHLISAVQISIEICRRRQRPDDSRSVPAASRSLVLQRRRPPQVWATPSPAVVTIRGLIRHPAGAAGWSSVVGRQRIVLAISFVWKLATLAKYRKAAVHIRTKIYATILGRPGASKGTLGDAKCVTEIFGGGTKIKKLGGQSLNLVS